MKGTDVTVDAAVTALANELDLLKPDDLDAEACVAVIAALTKGPAALTKVIKDTVGLLELRLAQLVPPKYALPIGGHTVRHKPGSPKRSEWQSDDLLRAVLDSRRFDPGTGELIDESPADKLMHVFGLSGSSAKITALKERGLNADEFCKVTREDRVEVV